MNPSIKRCSSCMEELHTAQDGTVYGHTYGCKNEVLSHCSGCTDNDPLGGTHAGHTIEHGHVGCEHEEAAGCEECPHTIHHTPRQDEFDLRLRENNLYKKMKPLNVQEAGEKPFDASKPSDHCFKCIDAGPKSLYCTDPSCPCHRDEIEYVTDGKTVSPTSKPEGERPFAPPLANEDIESITERIVILYANHSGRDSMNRAAFRNDVRKIIASELSTAQAGEKPSMIADLAGLPIEQKPSLPPEVEKEFDKNVGKWNPLFFELGLREREAEVMRLRNEERKTLEEVGKLSGVTRERIRQIEAKAIEKLRELGEIKSFLASALKAERERCAEIVRIMWEDGYTETYDIAKAVAIKKILNQ